MSPIVWQNHETIFNCISLVRSLFLLHLILLFMNVAIIAAAGQGTRMAGKQPKQFLELAGTPIIFHTLEPFEQCDAIQEIIVVYAPRRSRILWRRQTSVCRKSLKSFPEEQRAPSLY